MEMKEVLSREGREAKNLLVYQFCENSVPDLTAADDTPSSSPLVLSSSLTTFRKPPKSPNLPRPHTPKLAPSHSPTPHGNGNGNKCGGPRVRSASTGRDKKSELQARYWALLFGNLQRAVNEIYQTVECYENISSCQEAILVLENYVRDFKALSEWFKVSWDYEARPPQQRTLSLAWEVRKSNPAPRVRAKSLSSPTASGTTSPCLCACLSGKSSPCYGGPESGGSPRKSCLRACDPLPKGAMRVNVRELFAATKREPVPEQPAAPASPQTGVSRKASQYSQTDLKDDHLTLADLRKKLALEAETRAADQKQQWLAAVQAQSAATPLEGEENSPTPMNEFADVADANQTPTPVDESPVHITQVHSNEMAAPEALPAGVPPLIQLEYVQTTEATVCYQYTAGMPVWNGYTTHAPMWAGYATQAPAIEGSPAEAPMWSGYAAPPPVWGAYAPPPPHMEKSALEAQTVTWGVTYGVPPPMYVAPPTSAEPTAVELTTQRLDAMENELLAKDAAKPPTPQTAELKRFTTIPPDSDTQLPPPVAAPAATVACAPKKPNATTAPNTPSTALKSASVANRGAASRPGAPQTATAKVLATREQRPPITGWNVNKSKSTNTLRRTASTTTTTGQGHGVRAGAPTSTTSTTTVATTSRVAAVRSQTQVPPRPASKTEMPGPPTNAASRCAARSRTMLEMKADQAKRVPPQQKTAAAAAARPQPHVASREDVASSSSTLKASNERISGEPNAAADDGWFTVKNRRRSSMHWSSRFNTPTGYASLPTLALLNEPDDKEHAHDEDLSLPTSVGSSTSVATITSSTTGFSAVPAKQSRAVKPTKTAQAEKAVKPAARLEMKNVKAKVNSLPAARNKHPQSTQPAQAASKAVVAKPSVASVSTLNRETNIKRQKSDLTGLKMRSLHKEYMRSEKHALRKQNNQKQQATSASKQPAGSPSEAKRLAKTDSDFEPAATAPATKKAAASQRPSETEGVASKDDEGGKTAADEPDGGDSLECAAVEATELCKIDIKIQTNREFSKTIGELYDSLSTMTKAMEVYAHYDDSDEAVDQECDDDQRKLVEEQESLERQIRELESSDIDVDTETDETDCEVAPEHDNDHDGGGDKPVVELGLNGDGDSDGVVYVMEGGDENLSLELRYQALLSEMAWAEREQALATLQAYVSRHPGRAQELHQKLSSPSRRRSLHETLRKYQAKQTRAQQKREVLRKDKAVKIQQLLARVEDVKAAKLQLIEDKRIKMEGRLQRAAENREIYLRNIVEKAHDEDKKLKEINFIKSIEAQNKRLEMIESTKETEVRLQDLEQERQKRLEEKAAKEAAVERRRLELEKERLRKLEKMNETRLEKEQRIGKMQEQKERQRQALAREKARDREERLLALQAQQQQTTEELQRKIKQKQMESARRHEENIEHIRQRALELMLPTRICDENAAVAEDCDLSSSTVSDVSTREQSRNLKKKLKKLKVRMSQNADAYLRSMQPLPLHMKSESQVPKFLNLVAKGGGVQGLERTLNHLLRIMSKAQLHDFQCFFLMNGLGNITDNVITKGMETESDVSMKNVIQAVHLYRNVCTTCPQIGRHSIMSNSIVAVFEAIAKSLENPTTPPAAGRVELPTELMLACTVALTPSYAKKQCHPQVVERLSDVISYAVLSGFISALTNRLIKARGSVADTQSVVLSLLATIGLISRFVEICPTNPTADSLRFLGAIKATELFGLITLVSNTVVPVGGTMPQRTISLAAAVFNLLVTTAVLSLETVQQVLSEESVYLRFLDVIIVIFTYCNGMASTTCNTELNAVIMDMIAMIGFFCANKRAHQNLLVSDQYTFIVKSIKKLPACFDVVVFPCMLSLTNNNEEAREVIARDFDMEMLEEYRISDRAKNNHLVVKLTDETGFL